MQQSSILYGESPEKDFQVILDYCEEYSRSIGLDSVEVDEDALNKVVSSMRNMPWSGGVEQASAFKKAACFTTNFTFHAPLITSFPKSKFGDLYEHQNAIFAYDLSRDALHGATIERPYGGPVQLKNRIISSRHYWNELISTLGNANPKEHFQCVSLIYEVLAYRVNPEACYTHLFKRFPEMSK